MATRDEWRQRVSEWQSSGLSAHDFCEGRGISRQLLHSWSGRLRREADVAPAAEPSRSLTFARVVRSESSVSGIVVEMGSARVHVGPSADRATLAFVFELLRAAR